MLFPKMIIQFLLAEWFIQSLAYNNLQLFMIHFLPNLIWDLSIRRRAWLEKWHIASKTKKKCSLFSISQKKFVKIISRKFCWLFINWCPFSLFLIQSSNWTNFKDFIPNCVMYLVSRPFAEQNKCKKTMEEFILFSHTWFAT